MRTTVAIDDELLAAAKLAARQNGQTLGQLIESALRRVLNGQAPRPAAPTIPIFSGGNGPRPGIDLDSNRALYELLDEVESK